MKPTAIISGKIIRLATLRRISVHKGKGKIFYRDARGRAVHVACTAAEAIELIKEI